MYTDFFTAFFRCSWIVDVCFDVLWKTTENLNT